MTTDDQPRVRAVVEDSLVQAKEHKAFLGGVAGHDLIHRLRV